MTRKNGRPAGRHPRRAGRAAAALAVRRVRPGRDHPPRLPRGTPRRLPQPGTRDRTGPQTPRAAGRHRNRPGSGAGLSRRRTPHRGGPDRAQGRQAGQQVQDGQALRRDHHRHHPGRREVRRSTVTTTEPAGCQPCSVCRGSGGSVGIGRKQVRSRRWDGDLERETIGYLSVAGTSAWTRVVTSAPMQADA